MEPPRNEKVGQDHEHNQPDEAVNEDVGKVPHPTIERGKEGEENVVEREPLRSGQVLRLLIVNQVGRDGMNPLHYHAEGLRAMARFESASVRAREFQYR